MAHFDSVSIYFTHTNVDNLAEKKNIETFTEIIMASITNINYINH